MLLKKKGWEQREGGRAAGKGSMSFPRTASHTCRGLWSMELWATAFSLE